MNPCHVHRQDNDCGGDGFAEAEQLGTRRRARASTRCCGETEPVAVDGPEVVRHRVIDVTLGSTLLTAGREGRVGPGRARRVDDRPGAARLDPGRGIPRARPRDRRPRAPTARHVLLAGLAPEWHGYLPSPFRDGYEESTSYGRDAVAAIADALTH